MNKMCMIYLWEKISFEVTQIWCSNVKALKFGTCVFGKGGITANITTYHCLSYTTGKRKELAAAASAAASFEYACWLAGLVVGYLFILLSQQPWSS